MDPPASSAAGSSASFLAGSSAALVPGFVLLEVLGVGERASVYRARAETGSGGTRMRGGRHVRDPVPGGARGGEAVPRREVVLKVFAPGLGPTAGEVEVLAERPIAAMPALLGTTAARDGGAVLVMTFCPEPSLRMRTLLPGWGTGSGSGTDAGAVVALVEQLHRAGWAHGGIDESTVLAAEGGRPVLVGFGRACPRGDPSFDTTVVADLRAARDLVRLPRRHGTPARTDAVVRSDGAGDGGAGAGGAGSGGAEDGGAWVWDPEPEVIDDGTEVRFLETVEPAFLAARESASALREFLARRGRSFVRGRRRRLVVGLGVAVLLVAAVWLTLPSGDGHARTAAEQATVSEEATAPEDTTAPEHATPAFGTDPTDRSTAGGEAGADAGAGRGTDADAGATSQVAEPGPGEELSAAAVAGDDPVAAAAELLHLRDTCLAREDAACLSGADQWGSPAEEADRALLVTGAGHRVPAGDGRVGESPSIRLVQRVGGVALLEVVATGAADAAAGGGDAKPVPLLVIRSGTGWRVRSFGADP